MRNAGNHTQLFQNLLQPCSRLKLTIHKHCLSRPTLKPTTTTEKTLRCQSDSRRKADSPTTIIRGVQHSAIHGTSTREFLLTTDRPFTTIPNSTPKYIFHTIKSIQNANKTTPPVIWSSQGDSDLPPTERNLPQGQRRGAAPPEIRDQRPTEYRVHCRIQNTRMGLKRTYIFLPKRQIAAKIQHVIKQQQQ